MPETAPRPLSSLTTLRTGGEPARMWDAHDRDELVAALRDTWATGEPWFVLGGGSNLFVSDEPFEGTVIRILTRGIERLPAPAQQVARLRIQAGHDWDDLVAYTVAEGLSGIAAMSGIPGTVGAAPVQNVGAYGQEIIQTLVEVELIDESTGEVSTVPAAELGLGVNAGHDLTVDNLGLGFRTSVLKHHHGSEPLRRAVILSVTLDLLEVGPAPRRLRGAQLRQALGLAEDDAVTLQWVRDHVLATRARKGMVLDDADPDTYSAGSFFQNAVVSASFARSLPAECPRWPVRPDGADATSEPVRIIPLDTFDGYIPAAARRRGHRQAQRRVAHRTLRHPQGLPSAAFTGGALEQARARADQSRRRDSGGDRRARSLHPGAGSGRVRTDPAARTGARRRRPVGGSGGL